MVQILDSDDPISNVFSLCSDGNFLSLNHMQSFKVKILSCYISTYMSTKKRFTHTQISAVHIILIIYYLKNPGIFLCWLLHGVRMLKEAQFTHAFDYIFLLPYVLLGSYNLLVVCFHRYQDSLI